MFERRGGNQRSDNGKSIASNKAVDMYVKIQLACPPGLVRLARSSATKVTTGGDRRLQGLKAGVILGELNQEQQMTLDCCRKFHPGAGGLRRLPPHKLEARQAASPNAEPIKQWLARVGYERIQDMADPARAVEPCLDDPFPDYDIEPVMAYANG